jgi:hypothetical protein
MNIYTFICYGNTKHSNPINLRKSGEGLFKISTYITEDNISIIDSANDPFSLIINYKSGGFRIDEIKSMEEVIEYPLPDLSGNCTWFVSITNIDSDIRKEEHIPKKKVILRQNMYFPVERVLLEANDIEDKHISFSPNNPNNEMQVWKTIDGEIIDIYSYCNKTKKTLRTNNLSLYKNNF